MERIRRAGYSEVLLEFANRQKCRDINKEVQKKELKDPQLSLYHYDVGWYHEGVAKTESSVLLEMSRERVIEVDMETKQVVRVNGEEVSGVEHKQVLDLSDDGERWEGDVLNDQPYGWGVLYDSEGEKVYEGFRLKEVNVCYGRSYYPDIQKVEYEGGICEGKHWGRGVLYDRNGNTVFEGVWMGDKEIAKSGVIDPHSQLLHTQLEELVVSNECCSEEERTVFDFKLLPNLQRLKVGDKCFKHVTKVELVGMKQLKKVEIGENCFSPDSCWPPRKGCFRLKDCPLLRELMIGDSSFSYYSVCEIESVPSLRVLEIGKRGGRALFQDAPLELRSR